VRLLIERRVAGDAVRKKVDEFVADALKGVTDNQGQAARVAKRFGLVAIAGELAVEFGLVDWPRGKATEDARALFTQWQDRRGGGGPAEVEQIIAQGRLFLELHGGSRFDDVTTPDPDRRPVTNRAGYRNGAGAHQRWLVLPEVWRSEIFNGFDPIEAANALSSRGMLEKGEGRHYAKMVRLPGSPPQRFYVLTPAIFEGWSEE
jgi:putative DNA primase/helicase